MTSSTRASVTLPADDQILITREFAAPPRLLFRAWTEPELVKRWWHANRGEVTSVDIDLRVGGKWRWVMTANGGFEVAFHGEYREIVPDERLVSTEEFEGAPGHVAVNTLTFEEIDGRTHMRLLAQHDSKESRDAVIASGMEDGLQDALVLVEEVTRSLS